MQRLRQVSLVEETTCQEGSLSEGEQVTRRKKQTLKLGIDCTGATLVTKRINWPHEVYLADGKLAVYGDLSLAAFVRGYLIVVNSDMDTQVIAQMSQHFEECMEDTDLYGWDMVHAFHAAWLNQLEQGRGTWGDVDQKLKMHRALVWKAAMTT